MGHPLQDLKDILSPPPERVSGTVVAIQDGNVHVATPTGVVIRPQNANNYQLGDNVVVAAGELAGKSIPDSARPTFVL
jgi:hypothetical protein